MKEPRIALIGAGATGSVLAAALLARYPQTVIVGRDPDAGAILLSEGIRVSGVINYQSAVKNYISQIRELKNFEPDLIFLATKTFHLEQVLTELKMGTVPELNLFQPKTAWGPRISLRTNSGRTPSCVCP